VQKLSGMQNAYVIVGPMVLSRPRDVRYCRHVAKSLRVRVETAAAEALARQKYVTPVDIFVGIGWVAPPNVDVWRQGGVDSLDRLLPVDAAKLGDVLEYARRWAAGHGLKQGEVSYIAATRDRRPLRFIAGAAEDAERGWHVQWTSPELSAEQAQRITQKRSAPPDLVVIQPVQDVTSTECGEEDFSLLIMDAGGPLCMACADMDHLVFLPAGHAALTRRSKKASRLSAVVVRWSRSRKRYERQGLLVEQDALERAEQECLADEDLRARRRERDAERRAREDVEFTARFAAEIRRLYPRCPAARAEAIAGHAAVRSSGRVGRSTAARALEGRAITLAVVASIRHLDTDYDDLLMSGVARETARDRIRPAIDRVLASWS
jgi:hypothetical protein